MTALLLVTATLGSCTGQAATVDESCDVKDRSHWAIAYTKQEDTAVKGVYWLVDGEHKPLNKDKDIQAQDPSLSPDGRKVLFEGFHGDGGKYVNKKLIMNTDGSGLKIFGEGISTPVWSPNGKRLAYRDTDRNTILVSNPDGTDEREIAEDAASDPVWSADGENLAWIPNGANAVRWAEPEGKKSGMAQMLGEQAITVAWLPDGESVVVSLVKGDDAHLYRLNLSDTKEPELLAEDATAPFALPDGTIGARVDKRGDGDYNQYVSVDPKTGKSKNLAKIPGQHPSVIACHGVKR